MKINNINFSTKAPIIKNIPNKKPDATAKKGDNRLSSYLYQQAFLAKSQLKSKEEISKKAIDKINSLKGDPFDNADEIKEIILQDLGLPKDCTQLEIYEKIDGIYCDCLNMNSGNILLRKDDYLSNKELAVVIRHEIEHFRQSIAICKYFGIDEYKKYIKGQKEETKRSFPASSTKFNTSLWQNTALWQKVSIPRERCIEYINSANRRNKLENSASDDNLYKAIMENYLYNAAPDEIDAREKEDALAKKLGLKTPSYNTEDFEKFEEALTKRMGLKAPFDFSKKVMIDKNSLAIYAYLKSLIINNDDLFGLYQKYITKELDSEEFGSCIIALANDNDPIDYIQLMTEVLNNAFIPKEADLLLDIVYS